MRTLYADLETRSEVGLDTHGTHKYAESAEILLFPYALDDAPAKLWDAWHEPVMPTELREALDDSECLVVFHNVPFDRVVLRHTLIDLPIERMHCTKAQALAHSLPGKLDRLGAVLGLPVEQRKLKDGQKLIDLFCKKKADPAEYPKEWERFKEYAINDVVAMREIKKRMPTVNYRGRELEVWRLDQKINDRGIYIDLALARAAKEAGEKAKEKINERLIELTEGRVTKVTQTQRITNEIDALDMLDKNAVKNALAGELSPEDREILQLRQLGGRISTSKYEKLPKAVSSDGRLRGILQFCGASRTGRWSSFLLQLHNLPRPRMKWDQISAGITALRAGIADLVFRDVVGLCAEALRSVIVAAPGRRLVVADWSNIEGRVLAWLANEKWLLEAFRAYDAGTGPDVYTLLYARSMGVALETVDAFKRQMGKGMQLAMQYGGGVGAFLGISVSYELDLAALGRIVPKIVPQTVLKATQRVWERVKRRGATLGLPEAEYVASEALKRVWRNANPAIVNFWHALEDAAMKAIEEPGQRYTVGRVAFQLAGKTLMIILPSGRRLLYPNIRVTNGEISFMKAPGWFRAKLYGGFLAENITQAVARDILAETLLAAEAEGYEIILHVHDEPVAEVDADSGLDVEGLCEIMERELPWAEGLPLKADGFTDTRYKKAA